MLRRLDNVGIAVRDVKRVVAWRPRAILTAMPSSTEPNLELA